MEEIRVTRVLDYFKEPWYVEWVLREFAKRFKKCADVEKAQKFAMRDLKKIADEATTIGSAVDQAIKARPFEPAEPAKLDFEQAQCLGAYRKWLAIYKPRSISPCKRIHADIESVGVSGEPDLMVDDVLVDVKAAARINKKYWVQVNVYRYLEHLEADRRWGVEGAASPNILLGKVGILRLDKATGSYEYVVKDYDPSLVECWIGMMRAFVVFNKEELDDCGQ